MKNSTLKRLHRKRENLPLYFVDSSVFLEVLFEQPLNMSCLSFFHKSSYKYRLITSTVVLGEVIRSLNKITNDLSREKWLLFFVDLLLKRDIESLPISLECISNLTQIREKDSYLEASDSVIFSTAITENCSSFITLDNDFSPTLGREFNILIKRPF